MKSLSSASSDVNPVYPTSKFSEQCRATRSTSGWSSGGPQGRRQGGRPGVVTFVSVDRAIEAPTKESKWGIMDSIFLLYQFLT
jgi:hypothetical protein